jgi:hypothetical protein
MAISTKLQDKMAQTVTFLNCMREIFILNLSLDESLELGFEFLTAAVMNVTVFWDTAPCSPWVSRFF